MQSTRKFVDVVAQQITEVDALINQTTLITMETSHKDLKDCIKDINNCFKQLSKNTSDKIINSYKTCNIHYQEIKQDKEASVEGMKKIIGEQNNINKQFNRLKKIKTLFTPEQVDQIVKKMNPVNVIEEQNLRTELRFAHLDAAQLVILADVVNAVRNYLVNFGLKNNGPIFALSNDIIHCMKMRLEKESSLNLSLAGSISEINKSWTMVRHQPDPVNIMDEKQTNSDEQPIDLTFYLDVPTLPSGITYPKDFKARDYFLNYIHAQGNNENEEWAKKHGFEKEKFILDPIFTLFDPKKNPYSGLVMDGCLELYNKLVTPTIDYLNTCYVSLKGNWIAVEADRLYQRLDNNENYQKIKEDLAKKRDYLLQKLAIVPASLTALAEKVKKASLPEQEKQYDELKKQREAAVKKINELKTKIDSLEEDWVWVTSDMDWKAFDAEMNAISKELDQYQQDLAKNEEALQKLNDEWVLVQPKPITEISNERKESKEEMKDNSEEIVIVNVDDESKKEKPILSKEEQNKLLFENYCNEYFSEEIDKQAFKETVNHLVKNFHEENFQSLINIRRVELVRKIIVQEARNRFPSDEKARDSFFNIADDLTPHFKPIGPDLLDLTISIMVLEQAHKIHPCFAETEEEKKLPFSQKMVNLFKANNVKTIREATDFVDNKFNEFVNTQSPNINLDDAEGKRELTDEYRNYIKQNSKFNPMNLDATLNFANIFIQKKLALGRLVVSEIERIEKSEESFFDRFMSPERTESKLKALGEALETINKTKSSDELNTAHKNMLNNSDITQKRRQLFGIFKSTTKKHLQAFEQNFHPQLRKK